MAGHSDSTAFAVVDNGTVRGYGVIRPGRKAQFGPLFADDASIAQRLLLELWASAPGMPICIDIPDSTFNAAAEEILRPMDTRECSAPPACTRASLRTWRRTRSLGLQRWNWVSERPPVWELCSA